MIVLIPFLLPLLSLAAPSPCTNQESIQPSFCMASTLVPPVYCFSRVDLFTSATRTVKNGEMVMAWCYDKYVFLTFQYGRQKKEQLGRV